ncbi:ABC transporter permease [Nocardia amikacinitolerans]|uniref:ABC transporter permease n=1 Tax=Nocardia amikacinitolerans TaxID=756689 RepID=UPI0020A3911D|nr:FtsX-like permease family protein [Nocardia amikacinitolerans]MCP2288198.1 putative ABC transport system permease protein [Nocardia amikacinitolerans]
MSPIGTVAARFRLLALRDSLIHWKRSAIIVAIVAVSSALLVSVLTTYGSITASVARLSEAIAGDAAFTVHGATDAGVAADMTAVLARVPGVRAAVPVVQQQVEFGANGERATTLLMGADSSIAALRSPLTDAILPAVLRNAEILTTQNAIIAGRNSGLAAGETVEIGGTPLFVVGTVDAPELNRGDFVLAPLPLAEKVSGRPDWVGAVHIVLAENADPAVVRDGLVAAAGDAYLVSNPGYEVDQAAQSTRLLSTSALLVALVAFVVAVFLMFNTMHMAVSQRRTSISILRAVGADPRLIYAHLLVEGAVYGLVGAVLGIGAGILLGSNTIGHLPAFAIQAVTAEISYGVGWYAPVLAVLAALVSCVIAAAGAGLQVFRMSPVEALGGLARPARTVSLASIAAGVCGVALLLATGYLAVATDGQAALLATVTFPLGLLATLFAATRPLVGLCIRLARPFGSVGLLAAAAVARVPRRTWTNVATVVVTITVATAVSGALTSMADSTTDSYASLVNTDVYVTRTPADVLPAGALIDPSIGDRLRELPDVIRVVPGQWAYADVGGALVTIQGLLPGSNAVTLAAMSPDVRARVLAGAGVAVSRQLADARGYEVGDTLRLTTPSGPKEVRVEEVISTVSVASGTLAMSLPHLQEWYARPGGTYYELELRPGAFVDDVMDRIRADLPSGMYVYSGAQALHGTTAAIAQAGVIAVALQWTIAAVAAIGLLNTFTLAVLERRREIGVLRAVGALRRQTTGMIVAEACAVGAVGGAVGFVAGLALQYVSCRVLGVLTGFPVAFEPEPVAVLTAVSAVGICLVGALVPAIGAGRATVAEALAER